MKIILIILIAIVSSNVVAQENSKDQKLMELVDLMDMDSMVESMYSQMEVMMQNVATEMGVTPSEQPIFDEYYSKMTLVMRDEMSWKKMEPGVLDIYRRNFTEKEIDDMLVFYKSASGRSLLKKMPVITNESMTLGQELMMKTIPKLKEISTELAKDLEKTRTIKE